MYAKGRDLREVGEGARIEEIPGDIYIYIYCLVFILCWERAHAEEKKKIVTTAEKNSSFFHFHFA